jgi:hypothetical protein
VVHEQTGLKVKFSQWEGSAGPDLKRDLSEALEFHSSIRDKSFYTLLFNLLMKADGDNYNKLKSQFPSVAKEFEKYKQFGMNPDNNEIVIDKDF